MEQLPMMDTGVIIIYKEHNNEVGTGFDISDCLCSVSK